MKTSRHAPPVLKTYFNNLVEQGAAVRFHVLYYLREGKDRYWLKLLKYSKRCRRNREVCIIIKKKNSMASDRGHFIGK